MVPDDALARLAEMERTDLPGIFATIRARVGVEAFREAFFDIISAPGIENEETPRPRFQQLGVFLKSVGEPPPMLVDRLIPDKSLVLLAGKPKLGKSFLGVDLGDSVSRGIRVCGEYTVNRPGPVAYLGMEDGMYEVANRWLKRGARATDDRPFHVCTDRVVLSTSEGIELLREMLADIQPAPVLVIIDTAREALGIRDWNDAGEVSDKLRPLRAFARDTCSVLLVAHNRKQAAVDAGDEIAGSGAFASSVDGWISVQRSEKQPNGNRRMWLQIVGRGSMNGEAVVEMNTHDLHFRHISDEERADESRLNRFHSLVRAMRGMEGEKGTVARVAEALGYEYESARVLMVAAVREGIIEETGEKALTGGKGRPSPLFRVSQAARDLSRIPYSSIDTKGIQDNTPSQNGTDEGLLL